jgi:hypothetical protein
MPLFGTRLRNRCIAALSCTQGSRVTVLALLSERAIGADEARRWPECPASGRDDPRVCGSGGIVETRLAAGTTETLRAELGPWLGWAFRIFD